MVVPALSMRRFTISTTVTEFSGDQELPASDRTLLEKARGAAPSAYAPYSQFYVGSAVLLGNGEVLTGNNQENAAYPSGLCAERVAVFYAGAHFPGEKIEAVAVSCISEISGSDKPLSPCGSCRQVLAEYEQKQGAPIRIILGGKTGAVYVVESVNALLPLAFGADSL
jgi:cytidine deaminase